MIVLILMSVFVSIAYADRNIVPQSMINYGYGLMYDYSGQVLHGLNRYNLIVGLEIPDLRHPIGLDLIEDEHDAEACKTAFDKPQTKVTYHTCVQAWQAYLGFIERMRDSQAKLNHIYEKQLPAILPGFKAEDLRLITEFIDSQEIENWIVSRSRREVTVVGNDYTDSQTYDLESEIQESQSEKPNDPYFGITPIPKSVTRVSRDSIPSGESIGITPQIEENRYESEIQSGKSDTKERLNIDQKFLDSATTSDPKVRKKRQIFDLLSLGIQGFQAYEQTRSNSKIKRGLKILTRRQNFDHKKILHLEEDLVSLSKATLHEITELGKQLQLTGHHVVLLAKDIKKLTAEFALAKERTHDNSNAVMFLATTFSTLFTQIDRHLALYQRIENRMDTLLDALDNLSNNLLSHSVIPSDKLHEMIDSVRLYLMEYKPGYELVLTEVHQYYNLPTITFGYEEGTLAIQIPLFLKPKLQESLHLFHLKSIPVPFHVNPELKSDDETEFTYTEIIPSAKLLAMSSDTYIGLSTEDLANCLKVSHVYFCERMFLIKHHTEHTCESAIYHDETVELIKEKCDIRYYPDYDPIPQILDDGRHLLLGNLPRPWTVLCEHEDQIPNPLDGDPYVIIKKSDLCGCAISADKWYIEENIIHCNTEKDTEIQLFYPVNMAVMIYQFIEKMKKDGITSMSLFPKPLEFDPVEPDIVITSSDEILEEVSQPVGLALQEALAKVEERRYATKEDYAVSVFDSKNWFKESNPVLGFIIIASILTFIVTLGLIYLATKLFGLKLRVGRMNGDMTKMLMSAIMTLPKTDAKTDRQTDCIVTQNPFKLLDLLKIIGILIFLWILYKIVKYLYNRLGIDFLDSGNSKFGFLRYLSFDKTDIYLQLTQNFGRKTVMLYLGSLFGNPEDILVVDSVVKINSFRLDKTWQTDTLSVYWQKYKFKIRNLELKVPQELCIPFWKRYVVRKIYKNQNSMYKIVAYNASSCKVRALTTYQWMGQPFEITSQTLSEEFKRQLLKHEREQHDNSIRQEEKHEIQHTPTTDGFIQPTVPSMNTQTARLYPALQELHDRDPNNHVEMIEMEQLKPITSHEEDVYSTIEKA